MDYFLFNFSGVQFHYTMSRGNLIVSKGSLYVYLFELNLRNLLYVINNLHFFDFFADYLQLLSKQ